MPPELLDQGMGPLACLGEMPIDPATGLPIDPAMMDPTLMGLGGPPPQPLASPPRRRPPDMPPEPFGPNAAPMAFARRPFRRRGRSGGAERLASYRLPPVEESKKPEISWIEAERGRRESYWSARNEEMRLNENVYLMTDATETATADGDERLYRNIGRVMIDKLSFMVGREKHKIRVDARSDNKEFVEAAQECEDFLYEFNRQVDLEFSAVMNQGLGQTEAWYGACRGWLASRVWLDAASDFPFKASIFDPEHCYPQPGRKGAGQLIDMLYYEKADKFGFLSRNPAYADHDAIKDLAIDDEIEVTWYEDTTWVDPAGRW